MTSSFIWTVVIGMAVANYLTRFPPIAIVSRVRLPRPVMRWLSFIPISVMGALVALEVLRPSGQWAHPLSNPYLWAAIPTALVYVKTRSFLGATISGIVLFVAIRALIG